MILTKKSVKLSKLSILVLILIITFFSNYFIISSLGYWSDGALSKNIANNILAEGHFPKMNPGGWLEFFLTPMSIANPTNHHPFFSYLLVLIGVYDSALVLISIFYSLTTFFSIILLCTLFDKKKEKNFYLLAVLFSTIPLLLWNTGHIFVEPMIYLFSIFGIYFVFYKTNYSLATISIVTLFLLKVSTIPFLLFLIIGLFIKKREEPKKVLLILMICFLIVTPFLIHAIYIKGTISYAKEGIPILDSYIFSPYWDGQKEPWELRIESKLNESYLEERILELEELNKPFLLRSENYKQFYQYLSPFPIIKLDHISMNNWYGPSSKEYYNAFLVIFLIGVISIFKNNKGPSLLLGCSVILLLTFYQTGELRHGFIFSLIWGAYIFSSSFKLISKFNKGLNLLILTILIIFSFLLFSSEITYLERYENQYLHNLLPVGSAKDLQGLNLSKSTVVFCQDKNELPLYLGKPCIWDHRIFLLDGPDIEQVFSCYNSDYVVFHESFIIGGSLLEDLSNFDRTKIYSDSAFYSFLNNEDNFAKSEVGGFLIYEYKKQRSCP